MGKQIFKYLSDYTVFDIETTGLSPEYNKIIELSAVKVRNGEIIDTFSQLINPECTIGYESQCINGISNEMVKDAPLFRDIANDFLDFIGNDVLVGHNIARFDVPFIKHELVAAGHTLDNDYFDTLKFARAVLKNMYGYSIVNLATFYRLQTDGAQRALNDCIMNQGIYESMWKDENSDIAK